MNVKISSFVLVFALFCTMMSMVTAIKCFCLQNSGADTRLGLNRLACKRSGNKFHRDGCYVPTTNGCGVPPRGPGVSKMERSCKSLGKDWSRGYLNCRC